MIFWWYPGHNSICKERLLAKRRIQQDAHQRHPETTALYSKAYFPMETKLIFRKIILWDGLLLEASLGMPVRSILPNIYLFVKVKPYWQMGSQKRKKPGYGTWRNGKGEACSQQVWTIYHTEAFFSLIINLYKNKICFTGSWNLQGRKFPETEEEKCSHTAAGLWSDSDRMYVYSRGRISSSWLLWL